MAPGKNSLEVSVKNLDLTFFFPASIVRCQLFQLHFESANKNGEIVTWTIVYIHHTSEKPVEQVHG